MAIIEPVEHVGLRFSTNIVDCDAHDVCVGMPVAVAFESARGRMGRDVSSWSR